MPLKSGSSDSTVGHNIAQLIREGYERDQAAAIAYRKAGRSRASKVKAAYKGKRRSKKSLAHMALAVKVKSDND